MGLVKV
jgi:hypothetical protein